MWYCSCLGFAQLLSFSIWGMAALTTTKVFLSVIKVIETLENRNCSWEQYWSSERPYGCQEQLLLQKMSFNPLRYHLSSISGIRSLEDRKDSWEESWCSGWPYGCQDQSLFLCPHQKCHLTHQDSTCPPSLELNPWRTGIVPNRRLRFNVNNNPTLLNYLKQ